MDEYHYIEDDEERMLYYRVPCRLGFFDGLMCIPSLSSLFKKNNKSVKKDKVNMLKP
jgi:hypothetical protein